MSMIDKARIAVMDVLQRGNIPPGTSIDSEAIVRAVMEVMREPTEEMCNALSTDIDAYQAGFYWRAMIDAILNPSQT